MGKRFLWLCCAFVSCSQCDQTKESPPPVAPPVQDAGAQTVRGDDAEFGLTINDGSTTQLHAGWPIVVTLNALWVGEEAGSVEFQRSAVRLRVRNSADGEESWPWVLADGAERWTLAPAGEVAEVRWTLDASQSAALRPGRYQLDAFWGDSACEAIELQMLEAPAAPTAEQASTRAQLTARVASLRGDVEGAERAANEGLQASPNDISLLRRKALALEAKGDLQGAYGAIQDALDLVKANAEANPAPPGMIVEPPEELWRINNRIDRELFKRFMATWDGGR